MLPNSTAAMKHSTSIQSTLRTFVKPFLWRPAIHTYYPSLPYAR